MAGVAGRAHSVPRARFFWFAGIFAALPGLVTLGAMFVVVSRGQGVEFLRLLLPQMVYFSFALLLTRNVVLATLVAFAPLAGAAWSLALEAQLGRLGGDLNMGVALSSVLAFVFADEYEASIATDADGRVAAVAGLGAVWRPAAGALVPAAGALAYVVDSHWPTALARALSSPMPLSVLAVFALLPAGSILANSNELAIARVNRMREWRIRAAFPLTLTATPRWGLSISGAGLVVGVVSCFGAERLVATDNWIALATILAAVPAALALMRDWRVALGLGFSLGVTALAGLWAGVLQDAKSTFDAIGFYEALAIGFGLMIVVAEGGARSQVVPAGLAHAIGERAAVVVCATASVLCALLVAGNIDLVTAVVVVMGGLCSLLLVPAASSALEVVLPRRRSAVELYGRRP